MDRIRACGSCCAARTESTAILARRHGSTTVGAFLDPLADKVLVLGAMIFLVNSDVFWIVPVVIIAARELAISLYRTFVGAKGVSVPASKIAKLKTLTQQLLGRVRHCAADRPRCEVAVERAAVDLGRTGADQRRPIHVAGRVEPRVTAHAL